MKKTAIITEYSTFLLNCALPEGTRTMMQSSTKWFHLSRAPRVNPAKVFSMLEALHAKMYRFETPSLLVQGCSVLSHSTEHPAAPPAPAWSLLQGHPQHPLSTKSLRLWCASTQARPDLTVLKTSHNLASSKPMALQTAPTEAWENPPSHHPYKTNQTWQKVADASSGKLKIKKYSRRVLGGLVSPKPRTGNIN